MPLTEQNVEGLLVEAHALDLQAFDQLEPGDRRTVEMVGGDTRGPWAEALREVARSRCLRALPVLTRADALYWQVALQVSPAAKRLGRRAADREDHRQEALIGAYRAALRFEPARGVAFVTYARHWMRAEAGAAALSPLSAPAGAVAAAYRLEDVKRQNPRAADAELAAIMDISEARMAELRVALARRADLVGEDGEDGLEDDPRVVSEDGPEEAAARREAVELALFVLTQLAPSEARILRHAHGLVEGHRAGLAREMGVSRQYVHQLEREALASAQNVLASPRKRAAAHRARAAGLHE